MDHTSFSTGSPSHGPLNKLETFLEEYLIKKAPYTLPSSAKELIVKVAPWANIIGAILILPLLLAVLGLSALTSSLWYGFGFGSSGATGYEFYWLGVILFAITFVLELLAIPGLFKRTLGAWRLLFYAVLLRAVGNIVDFNFSQLIGMIFALYFLFQVKSYYR